MSRPTGPIDLDDGGTGRQRRPARRLLITGFEPFGGSGDNPSQRLVERLAAHPRLGPRVTAAVLPTSYQRAAASVLALLARHTPDLVLAFGVASDATAVALELAAFNVDDAAAADNDGDVRRGSLIIPGAPRRRSTTFGYGPLARALDEHGVPSRSSTDPGRYVCNHVLYRLLHHAPGTTAVGFVHIPPTIAPEVVAEALAAPLLALVSRSLTISPPGAHQHHRGSRHGRLVDDLTGPRRRWLRGSALTDGRSAR